VKFHQSIAFTPLDHIPAVVQTAEETGFEGVGLAHHIITPAEIRSPYPYTDDHHIWWDPAAPFPDCWVLSAALAMTTQRVNFCTSIFILPVQDPFTVAKSVSTAAVLSGNRVQLGVGAGWMKEEFDLTGQDFSNRGARMDEMLDVIAGLMAGGMFEYHGKFYDFEPIQMSPVPTAPVPVYIGGHSKPALRRAAKADGWFGAGPYTPEEVTPILVELQEARKQAGTLDRPYECIVGLTTEPDYDVYRRLEELGTTAIALVPAHYLGIENPTIDDRRRMMEDFASKFIQRMA
jgi:probable F420-dependent oxidoreductase